MDITFEDFRRELNVECQSLTGRPASSHKQPSLSDNGESQSIDWWRSTGRNDGRSQNSINRTKAYLRTYRKIFGKMFDMAGVLTTDKKLVRPDRSVIERSLRDGYLRHHPGSRKFEFTDNGES